MIEEIAQLKTEIDQVLDIPGGVDWHQVPLYICQLEIILSKIQLLGINDPAQALATVRYFLERIPSTFDRVQDKDELGIFCRELAEAACELVVSAKLPIAETANQLLDAWVRDKYGRFTKIPHILAEATLPENDRAWLIEEVQRRLMTTDGYQQVTLRQLIEQLKVP